MPWILVETAKTAAATVSVRRSIGAGGSTPPCSLGSKPWPAARAFRKSNDAVSRLPNTRTASRALPLGRRRLQSRAPSKGQGERIDQLLLAGKAISC